MASSPSSMSGRRNRPGCMSGIAHLFDFNQALAGRKLLTDKKYRAGPEALRNTSNGNIEQFKFTASSGRQNEFTKSASVSRRSVDVSMKALIADEISQELPREADFKGRAPSVVARLMGLDALPSDRSHQESMLSGELENSLQKVPSDRLNHNNFPGHNSYRGFKSTEPPTRSMPDLLTSKRSSWEEHTSMYDTLSSQGRSCEQQPKEISDPRKDWKSEDCAQMQAFDDLDSQLAAKQMLIKKKLSEAKLGLLSKQSDPHAKLYESREFMDAIDFLQANRDFFARFLEEPDSLFAKHLQNSEGKAAFGKIEEVEKRHSFTAQNWRKGPPDMQRSPHRKDRQVNQRSSAQELFAQAFSPKALDRHVKSAKYSSSSNGDIEQAPTRIVVLKPGPGKARSLIRLSQNSPRSPREFFDSMEVAKDNSLDVLKDLKSKLQQEDARGHPRKAWTSVDDQSMPLRDPRDIAREIARQVRENVTKDMKILKKGGVIESGHNRKTEFGELVDVVSASRVGSGTLLGRDRAFLPNSANQRLDVNTLHGCKGELRRQPLDHLFFKGNGAQQKVSQKSALRIHRRHGNHRCRHKHTSLGVHGVDRILPGQVRSLVETDVDCDTDSCNHSVCESEVDSYARTGHATSITLLRSRSVPTSSSSFCEVKEMDPQRVRNGVFVAGEANVADIQGSFDAGLHQSASFRRKRPVVKGGLLMSEGHVKGLKEMPIPLPTQKSHLDASTEHEKVQHQIDDMGPILDSDSSMSSLDNFLTLEESVLAEERDVIKLLAKAKSPASGYAMPRKPNIFSPGESPTSSSRSSIDVGGSMAAEHDTSKDPPEQPSPVSVLEASFEEPESPMDFTEISSGLQELRVRLQLLTFVDQEAISNQDNYQEEDCDFMDDNPSASSGMHTMGSHIDYPSHHSVEKPLLGDIIFSPQRREPELIYVKNLLMTSGFTIDNATVLTRWHAPGQPLAMSIFERVENSYNSNGSDKAATVEGVLDSQARRLLFDVVNEVLLEVLGHHVNRRSWWICMPKPSIMPCREDLVGQVWSRVCNLLDSQSEGQDSLGSLVARDLTKKDGWWDCTVDIEIVVLDVEKAIWRDLMEETLCRI